MTSSRPGGSAVAIAVPRGASATNAIVPAENSPAGVCHHGEAGMVNVEEPGPQSTGFSPVRWWIGGAGVFPASVSRIRSSPLNPSTDGSEYPPRTGSCQIGTARVVAISRRV